MTTISGDGLVRGECAHQVRAPDGSCADCGQQIAPTAPAAPAAPAAAAASAPTWMEKVAVGSFWIGAGTLLGGAVLGAVMTWPQSRLFLALPVAAIVTAWGIWRLATVPGAAVADATEASPAPASPAPVRRRSRSRRSSWRSGETEAPTFALGNSRLFGVLLRIAGVAMALVQFDLTHRMVRAAGLFGTTTSAAGGTELDLALRVTVAAWALMIALCCCRATAVPLRRNGSSLLIQACWIAGLCVVLLVYVAAFWHAKETFVRTLQFAVATIVYVWSVLFFVAFGVVVWQNSRAAGPDKGPSRPRRLIFF